MAYRGCESFKGYIMDLEDDKQELFIGTEVTEEEIMKRFEDYLEAKECDLDL